MGIVELLGKLKISDLRYFEEIGISKWNVEVWLVKLAITGHENGFARMYYPDMIRALVNTNAKVGEVTYTMSTAKFTIWEKAD